MSTLTTVDNTSDEELTYDIAIDNEGVTKVKASMKELEMKHNEDILGRRHTRTQVNLNQLQNEVDALRMHVHKIVHAKGIDHKIVHAKGIDTTNSDMMYTSMYMQQQCWKIICICSVYIVLILIMQSIICTLCMVFWLHMKSLHILYVNLMMGSIGIGLNIWFFLVVYIMVFIKKIPCHSIKNKGYGSLM